MTRQERKAAAQAKAQAALDRLGDGIRSVWQSESWRRWLDTLAKFHDYSLNNTMLIAMQMPEATRVASYRSWQKDFNRHVRKGERGIEVLVPMVVKRKDANSEGVPQDDEEATERRKLVGFKVGHVFDVSQTEGEPLPQLAATIKGNVKQYEDFLEALERSSPVPVCYEKKCPPTATVCSDRASRVSASARA